MKKFANEIWSVLSWNPLGGLIYLIFRKLSAKITRDDNYRSNKNEFLALFLIFLSAIIIALIVLFYSYYSLPWSSLQKHYAHYAPVEYQENEYELTIRTPEDLEHMNLYYVRLMLNGKGFYFSRPINLRSGSYRTNVFVFEHPLFIPWASIQECKKAQYENHYEMQMKIENTKVLLELALWDFLKPLCAKYEIPIVE